MTEKPEVPELDGDEDSRRQLWIRAGVAGGLIALLLGGLAVFDHLSRPPQPEEVIPTKPIAPAQLTPEPRQDAPPEVVRATASEPAAETSPTEEESVPPPVAAGDRDGRIERGARLAEGGRSAARPLQAHSVAAGGEAARKVEAHGAAASAAVAPVPPASVAPTAVAPTAPATPALAAASPVPPARTAAPAAAVSQASSATAVTAPAPVVKPAVAAQPEAHPGYVVQVGSFSSVVQAEALRARLLADGIAAQLETRVVVGPFPDRRDGLAAQARLRERGYSASDLIPFRR